IGQSERVAPRLFASSLLRTPVGWPVGLALPESIEFSCPPARRDRTETVMSSEASTPDVSASPPVQPGEARLEVAVIPVSDVDRSKQFYESLGWRLDDDVAPMDGLRIVQFTPPGSGCSVSFGTGIITSAPGSAEATLVVSDIEAAHVEFRDRGIDVSDVWHGPPFPPEARMSGP